MVKSEIYVDVVLATYNGEKFISEQVESILKQTHKKINIIISDDNSRDRTKEIIDDLSLKNKNITFMVNDGDRGVVGNFNNALKMSTSDYIMFCDQDDVWNPDKVEKMLALITSEENNMPALAFSDLEVVDSKLNTIYKSYYSGNGLNPLNNKKHNFLTWKSTCYGCTVILNRKLFQVAGLVPEYASMHDHWYAYIASKSNSIYYLPEATIKYRQHENNVVGSHDSGFISKLKRIKKTILSIKKNVIKTSSMLRVSTGKDVIDVKYRLQFIRNNILPFYRERTFYAVAFMILWIIYA